LEYKDDIKTGIKKLGILLIPQALHILKPLGFIDIGILCFYRYAKKRRTFWILPKN
jgi:hypothetical protein